MKVNRNPLKKRENGYGMMLNFLTALTVDPGLQTTIV